MKPNSYYIKQERGGYIVYCNGKPISEPDVLQMAFAKVTALMRKDLGV